MSVSLPRGFNHLPVTSLLIIMNVTMPVLLSLLDAKYYLDLRFNPQIYEWHQYYRIPINGLAFSNESQVMLSSILLYYFRCLERHKSPVRILSNLLVIYFYNVVFITFINLLFYNVLLDRLNFVQYLSYSSGPFCLIGGLLYDYNLKIPSIYHWQLSGILPGSLKTRIVLTDKVFLYFLCFQLCVSDGISSVIPSIQGYLISALLNLEILPGKHWTVPFFKRLHKIYYRATCTGYDPLGDNSNAVDAANTDIPGTDLDPSIYPDDGVDPSRTGATNINDEGGTATSLADSVLSNIRRFES